MAHLQRKYLGVYVSFSRYMSLSWLTSGLVVLLDNSSPLFMCNGRRRLRSSIKKCRWGYQTVNHIDLIIRN